MGVFVIEVVLAVKLCLITSKYVFFVDVTCDFNETALMNDLHNKDEYLINGKRIRTWNTIHVLLFLFAFLISFLNMLEYLQLAWGTWKYICDLEKHSPESTASSELSIFSKLVSLWRSRRKWMITVVIVFFLLLIPFLKFCVGVLMEVQKSKCIQENSSAGILARVYVTYCVFEFLNATLLACSVRVLLYWQMDSIQNVWFGNKEEIKAPTRKIDYPDSSINKIVRETWHKEKKEYEKRGKLVKRLMTPFKDWFLTPWLIFLFMTFINPHTLLTPWTRYEESKLLSMSQVYYLLLVIMKAAQLFIQNVCAVKMNIYHREYFRKMVKRFKKGFTNETNEDIEKEYQEEARDFAFVFNDKFNFYPSILCIDAKINLDTPLYVLGLVLGIFITASDGLFKQKL